MSETRLQQMEELAKRYMAHIDKIGLDFPEARAARRSELHDLYVAIAEERRLTPPSTRGE